MPGDEHIKFTDKEKSEIEYYGNMYNASSTAAERKHWHDLANNVRTEAMMNEAQSWVMGIAGGGDAEAAEGAAKTVGNIITGYTKHGLESAMEHNGVGVSPSAILDAVKNPTDIIPQVEGKLKYIGKNAVVVLNKIGKVVTTWATNHFGWRY